MSNNLKIHNAVQTAIITQRSELIQIAIRELGTDGLDELTKELLECIAGYINDCHKLKEEVARLEHIVQIHEMRLAITRKMGLFEWDDEFLNQINDRLDEERKSS